MRFIYLALLLAIWSLASVFASDRLVHIRKDTYEDIKPLFIRSELTIHYYSDNEVIASLHGDTNERYTVIDATPWEPDENYYIVNKKVSEELFLSVKKPSDSLIKAHDRLILVSRSGLQVPPIKDSFIHIANIQARLPVVTDYTGFLTAIPDTHIQTLVDTIDQTRIQDDIQSLQNFVTRNCFQQGGVNAQAWLVTKFSNLGYSVSLQSFTIYSQDVTDNVIAIKIGSKYPDQYVIVGAHYDSIISGSNQTNAPGADDNASGVAGVLEIARVLKDSEFDCTVVFCAFSGEEYGLYGSAAYAQSLVNAGKTVLAYLNLDMIGYRHPSQTRHADMMAPLSAAALKSYFVTTASLYVPDLAFEDGGSIGGDSDHTSFNQRGFPGVWPFEDTQYYSPYIHSTNDILGTSVNDIVQARLFTQATLAVFVSLAGQEIDYPLNLRAEILSNGIRLTWDAMSDYDGYQIYRNGVFLFETSATSYDDVTVIPGNSYVYTVRAVKTSLSEFSAFCPDVTVRYKIPTTTSVSIFPQPAQDFVEINVMIAKAGELKVELFSSKGKLVSNLFSGITSIGYRTFIWNFTDTNGRALPSGLYYCVVTTSSGRYTQKIVRVK